MSAFVPASTNRLLLDLNDNNFRPFLPVEVDDEELAIEYLVLTEDTCDVLLMLIGGRVVSSCVTTIGVLSMQGIASIPMDIWLWAKYA